MKVLFFVVICLIHATIFPSTSVQVCTDQGCTTKLFIMVLMNEDGVDFNFEFILDKSNIMIDQTGGKWIANTPIQVNLKRQNTLVKFPLNQVGTFYNTYERVDQGTIPCMFFTDPTKKCCQIDPYDTNLYYIDHNQTLYSYSNILNYYFDYQFIIELTQGTTIVNVILTPQQPTVYIPGIKSSIQFLTTKYFGSFDYYYLIQNQRLIIPKFYFPPTVQTTNIFNMNSYDFVAARDCSYPLGYLIQINNGDIYNQLSTFTDTLDSNIQCQFNQLNSNNELEYFCTQIGTMSLVLEIETSNTFIKINQLIGIPFVTNAGVLPYYSTDSFIILFIDLMNKGLLDTVFEIQPTGCCLQNNDCNTVQIQNSESLFIQSMNTKRFMFYVNIKYLMNQSGYCNFNILQQGIVNMTETIPFNIISQTPSVPNIQQCTYDQLLVNNICRFVNCTLKYNGFRNYQNLNTGYCESTPSCIPWKESYDPLNNICIPLSFNNSTTNNPSSPNSPSSPGSPTNQFPIQINCGPNGILSPDQSTCICNDGWTTSYAQSNYGNFLFCTIRMNNQTNLNSTLPESSYSGTYETGIIVIAGSGLFIILFVASSCFLCCFIKFYCCKKRHKIIKDQEEFNLFSN